MTTLNTIIDQINAGEHAVHQTTADPVVEEARKLSEQIRKLSTRTSQVNRIDRICGADQPDRAELREALLEQCRELTGNKQAYSGRSESILADFANRCFDLAMQC